MLGLVSHVAAEVPPNDAVPSGVVLLVKLLGEAQTDMYELTQMRVGQSPITILKEAICANGSFKDGSQRLGTRPGHQMTTHHNSCRLLIPNLPRAFH